MVTYLGGSILITIFALGGSIVSYNLQSSKLDSVLSNQAEEVKDLEPSKTLLELIELIKLHNVPSQIIEKWCSKPGVESIADLGEERQLACIEYIIRQYNYSQDIEAA